MRGEKGKIDKKWPLKKKKILPPFCHSHCPEKKMLPFKKKTAENTSKIEKNDSRDWKLEASG